MKHPLSRHSMVLIVRVWAEYLEQDPPSWRGEIEHASTKEVHPFTSLAELVKWFEVWERSHATRSAHDMEGEP